RSRPRTGHHYRALVEGRLKFSTRAARRAAAAKKSASKFPPPQKVLGRSDMRPTRAPSMSTLLATALFCAVLAALHSNADAQSVSSTARALQAVNGEAAYDNKIPPDVRALLTQLKHQLRDLIQKTLDESVSA